MIKLDDTKKIVLAQVRNFMKEIEINFDNVKIIGSFLYNTKYNDIDLIINNELDYSKLLFHIKKCPHNISPNLIEDKELFENIHDYQTFEMLCMSSDIFGTITYSKYYKFNSLEYNKRNIYNNKDQNRKCKSKLQNFLDSYNKYKKEKDLLLINIQHALCTDLKEVKDFLCVPNVLLAGGSLRDLLQDKTPKDYDIFTTDLKTYNTLCKKINDKGICTINSDHNINRKIQVETFKLNNGIIIDVIYNNQDISYTEILNEFDFTINMLGYKIFDKELIGGMNFEPLQIIGHIKTKELIISPAICYKVITPIRILKRLNKFLDKGYSLDSYNKSYLKNKILELI